MTYRRVFLAIVATATLLLCFAADMLPVRYGDVIGGHLTLILIMLIVVVLGVIGCWKSAATAARWRRHPHNSLIFNNSRKRVGIVNILNNTRTI
jgi:hypothetical protein